MEEQENQLNKKQNKQGFWEKLKQAVLSKTFRINFVVSIIIVLLLFIGTFYSLDLITHHGESLSVPDFTGMNIEQVKKIAEDKNLKYKIIDSVWDAPGKKGSVIAQTPLPDFKVKEGRTILLTVKTFSAPKTKMPDFTRIDLIQAKADMERFGFRLGKIIYKQDDLLNNWVDQQLYKGKPIAPGTPVEKGAKIDLVVFVKSSYAVPNFKGFTKKQAEEKCENLGLTPKFIYDDKMSEVPSAKIWKQSPPSGVKLTSGTTINLWLTIDLNKLDYNE